MMSDHLPLDNYPYIEFGKCDGNNGHTSPEKSVTTAAVTHLRRQPVCMMCGVPVSWRAKTCSANCRKALSRRHEAIEREVNQAKDALRTLERYSDQWPDLYWQIMQAIGQCGIAASSTSRRVAPKGDALPNL